jgi:hypothetical protein
MSISITNQAFDELLHQEIVDSSQHPDPNDELDVMYNFPRLLGQGYWREIKLRPGLELAIGDLRLCDRVIYEHPKTEHWLHYHFHFSGEHEDKYTSISGGQYIFHGSGLTPKMKSQCDDQHPV